MEMLLNAKTRPCYRKVSVLAKIPNLKACAANNHEEIGKLIDFLQTNRRKRNKWCARARLKTSSLKRVTNLKYLNFREKLPPPIARVQGGSS